jgi:hypothetical protein
MRADILSRKRGGVSAFMVGCVLSVIACAPNPVATEIEAPSGGGWSSRIIYVDTAQIVCNQIEKGSALENTWAGRANRGELVRALEAALTYGSYGGYILARNAAERRKAVVVKATASIDICVQDGPMHGAIRLDFQQPSGAQATVDAEITSEAAQFSAKAANALGDMARYDPWVAALWLARSGNRRAVRAATPTTAAAQPVSAQSDAGADEDPKRVRTRALASEGVELCQKGDYAAALATLDEAYRLMPAPTIRLWRARAMAGLGKLVEARTEIHIVSGLKLGADVPEPFRQAQKDAQADLPALDERIPMVLLEIENANPSMLEITIDGRRVTADEIASAAIGVGLPVNPGTHKLDVRLGDRQLTRELTIAEGAKSERVVLRFSKKQ